MKLTLITLSILAMCACFFTWGYYVAEPVPHECENEWWARFGKDHIPKCDTMHEKCFRR